MYKYLFPLISVLIFFNIKTNAQDYSAKSITTSIAHAINEGIQETGMGFLVSAGFQKSYHNDRFRLNPYIMSGGFMPLFITDTRDQYYRITTLAVNCYFDIIKYRAIGLYIGAGGFGNISRGLLGTGGWPEAGNTSSEYLVKLYYGGYAGAGIRVNPAKSRIAYIFSPLNYNFGNNYFFTAYAKFGIDIKLNNKVKTMKIN